VHISLSGYYGFDNAGDEALLSAITSSIRRIAGEIEFTVLSGVPQKTRDLHGIPAVYYFNPLKVIQTVKNTDLLISGGGSIFQDVTSGRSLFYYICVVALALFFNKPIIFYAQGVGPINRRVSKFLMRLVGNQVHFITLRDRDSMDYLHEIGVCQPPMRVTADPVFALRPTALNQSQMKRYASRLNPQNRPLIGVSLRNWAMPQGFQPRLAALLDGYYDRGYGIVFIPMAVPDDIAAGEETASLMKRPYMAVRENLTSQQYLALTGELALMVGMRLHSLIFAASQGIPLAGISYDPKVDSFLKILNLHPLPADPPDMRRQLDALLEKKGVFPEIESQIGDLRQQADENARLALALIKKDGAPAEPEEPAAVQPEPLYPGEPVPLLSSESKRSTGRNFIMVAVTIFISKVIGFSRDILFAFTFGTTTITDAFQTIFGLPSLLFTSIGNALSAVNIPDLTLLIRNKTARERQDYISNLFAQITLFFGVLSLLGIVLAPFITNLLAPGLDDSVSGVAVTLCKIMMPCLLFVNLTYLSAGILQSHRFFILSSVISIPFNLIIILSLVLRGSDIMFIGYMTTAGWFLQFFIQYPRLRRLGYRVLGRISFSSPLIKNIYRNLLPILLGNSVLQICLVTDRRFGTLLSEGSSSALAFSSNLFLTITSVFVVAMSIVVFPRLSQFCQERDFFKIRELIGTVFQILIFILLPYLVIIIFFHRDIIMILFERGAFNQESTAMTSTGFLYYSFVAIGYACQEIFNRVFYALKKYMIPMVTSLACILLNLLLNTLLYRKYGITGISLTTAFCMLLYACILFLFLRKVIGTGMGLSLLFGMLRCLLPLGLMLAVILAGQTLGASVTVVAATLAAGGGVYLVTAYLMGFGKILKR
jgi:putative peptidoglycan lipid II flippase